MDTNLKVGGNYKYRGYEIHFNSISGAVRSNYTSLTGNFKLINSKGNNSYFRPEIRIYSQPSMITSEANIKTNFFYDTFLAMSNIQGSEFYNIRFQKKYFMLWIWLSTLLIVTGGLVSVFKKKKQY